MDHYRINGHAHASADTITLPRSAMKFEHSSGEPESGHLPQGYKNLKTKPGFRKKVLEIMADGEWHTAVDIFESFRATFPAANEKTVQNAIGRLVRFPPPGQEVVPQRSGHCFQYRLRKSAASARQVPTKLLTDFIDGFPELLRQLEEWSDKGQYEIVPSSLQGIAVKMKRLFTTLKQSISS
jgi:hypothetical protein